MKLTNEQIEAIRALSAELADKLEAGESVTLEPPPKVWEPQDGCFRVHGDGDVFANSGKRYRDHGAIRGTEEAAARLARDQRIFNRLHAYREEFAPGYVVPPVGEKAYTPMLCADGKYKTTFDVTRVVGVIYMPYQVCEELCDKLNSGEVVL